MLCQRLRLFVQRKNSPARASFAPYKAWLTIYTGTAFIRTLFQDAGVIGSIECSGRTCYRGGWQLRLDF
jgi:hypothetical protein